MAKLTVSRFSANAEAVREFKKSVDDWAEHYRLSFITAGAGQSMTYAAKAAEALRYPEGPMPFLEAEAQILGTPLVDLVNEVLAAQKNWEVAGSYLEAGRIKAKRDIEQAATPEQMHRITENFRTRYRPVE